MTDKMQTRLEMWADSRFISIGFTSAESDLHKALIADIEESGRSFYESSQENCDSLLSELGLIRAARELIFDQEDGRPVFHYIMYSFNVVRGQLEVSNVFIGFSDDDEKDDDFVRRVLAMAIAVEVPVYPNSEDLQQDLLSHYRELLKHGFTAPAEDGEPMQLKLVRAPAADTVISEFLEERSSIEMVQPAHAALIRDALLDKMEELEAASAMLMRIDLAIGDLEKCLVADAANETALQKCLTSNPVLFGVEYAEVLPKHRLGGDYEMDYALRRSSGLVDLVEIEASTHRVFTRKGNPTAPVVHAEQQIFDWLSWMERNHAYARQKLPGIVRPTGFVIIGRSESLSKGDSDKLVQRNQIHRGSVSVLTYDMLLARAKTLRTVLTGA